MKEVLEQILVATDPSVAFGIMHHCIKYWPNAFSSILDRENPDTFNDIFKVSFGFYYDLFVNDEKSIAYRKIDSLIDRLFVYMFENYGDPVRMSDDQLNNIKKNHQLAFGKNSRNIYRGE